MNSPQHTNRRVETIVCRPLRKAHEAELLRNFLDPQKMPSEHVLPSQQHGIQNLANSGKELAEVLAEKRVLAAPLPVLLPSSQDFGFPYQVVGIVRHVGVFHKTLRWHICGVNFARKIFFSYEVLTKNAPNFPRYC